MRAGESLNITLSVDVVELPAQIVDLELRDVPEGWSATFQGGGRIVHSVYARPEDTATVTLNVEVPEGITDGSYSMTVSARGSGRTATLPLELIIGKAAPPAIALDPELPILNGTPTTNFSFRVKLENKADVDLLINLEAELPEGFEATFKKAFGGQELTTVPVSAGATETIDMALDLPDQTPAGEYKINLRAQAADVSDQVELTAIVSGQPSLSLSAPDGRLSGRANAGRETPLELVLRNDGTAPAESISLESSPPSSWNVRMEPEVVESIAPGEEVQVKAYITPPDTAIAGDYVVTVRARPETGSLKSVEFRITVVTSTLWGVVGVLLIAAALVVVAVAVGRFGRR